MNIFKRWIDHIKRNKQGYILCFLLIILGALLEKIFNEPRIRYMILLIVWMIEIKIVFSDKI